ncbi:MAG: DNA polymerase/3'-5' exonuclease PolX [Gemmataceae bacterium]
MDKNEVAAILEEIGTILELQGENSFRCNAYHNAGRAIAQLEENLDELVAADQLGTIPGIGSTLKDKISTLVKTGGLPFYDELKKKTPAGLIEMLRLPSMGPKKVKLLYEQLGIDDLDKLRAACQDGRVATIKGFGQKTQDKILEGLAFLGQMGRRVRLDEAMALSDLLVEGMRKVRGVRRLEVCGSVRRRRETVADIDLLISADDAGPIMKAFVTLPQVQKVIAQGETKSSVMVMAYEEGGAKVVLQADLRVVSDKQFPFALNYFTGSKEHNVAMRQRAIEYGLKLNEYELVGEKKSVACKDEADIYKALDLDYVPPELRENTGEIAAAARHELPALIAGGDLTGVFHCHTDWSDGAATLEEMANAARKLGLKYLGIGDHSQSLKMANGLTPERVREQQERIDELNGRLRGFHVFKGTECDILADGALDFPDEVLETFDYVVASVHTHFGQTQEDMTRRIVRAVSHPKVTMLGHATGRLILRRDAYKVDLDAVLKAAAEHGTMIEINASPQRLDIDWVQCKRARALGVKLVINPDAHAPGEIAYTRWGVNVARRGWLEKGDVFNTQSLAEVTRALARMKQRKR